ncbi:MAG: aldo/keto reductase [Myxococcales bacterium]|nr:aldo/keto reductase [Myxococcales bacterium]
MVALLDGLGDPARQLVGQVLAGPARPGAIAWAIGWVVATRDVELAPRAWACAVTHDLRELALSLAPPAVLRELLGDAALVDHPLAVAAAQELVLRPAMIRREVLAAIREVNAPAVRAALIAAADDPDSPHVHAGLTDHDPLARALALSTLAAAGRLSPVQQASALADRDPAVREAVLGSSPPAAVIALLETERDPWVRRTAARVLARRTAVAQPQIALALTGDPDPWIRAYGAGLLAPADPAQRARLVELVGDRSPAVQAAIVEQLASLSDAELRAALPTASSEGSRGVQAWLDTTDLESMLAAGERAAAHVVTAAAPGVISAAPADEIAVRVTSAERAAPPASRIRRTFGRSGVEVTPLAVSGAFDLSPGSLHVASEAGVELMFWEPTYAAMTRFLRVRARRDRTCVVTGSYHADAASIHADVDRALRRLRRDTLDVFLLFWARSPARLDEAAFDALDQLKRAGKLRAIGFSTHDRGLAIDALARSPWDVVMTRHSAAHPGIEDALLARAQAAGAGVLTFSALCYGRMVSGPGAPEPADCYRYSLSQPGVTACITAPRRHRELVENLAVLERTQLDETELARLRAHGAGVRIENQRFNTLIRQPTRDAAAAAMAMLEAELAPDDIDGAVSARSPRRPIAGRGKASPSALRRGRL